MGIIVPFAGFCYSFFFVFSFIGYSLAIDILTPSLQMTDNLTLVSAGKNFEFGFFRKANSNYLGIWYYNMIPQTIVWVGNRNSSLHNTSGVARIVEDGNFVLQDSTETILWSTNLQNISSNGTVLQLLDSGNLVLRYGNNENAESYLWESFDHLSDTWLPGMKMGKDSRTGLNRYFTSWNGADDPSPGQFTYRMSSYSPPLEFVLRKGDKKKFRTGPYNGVRFNGVITQANVVFNLRVNVTLDEMYYEYIPGSGLPNITMSTLTYSGEIQRFVWNRSSLEWLAIYTLPIDPCDNYGQCGANGICTISDFLICSCLTGYIPKSPQDWEIQLWSDGCTRKYPLNCSQGEGFLEVKGVKVPDKWQYWISNNTTLEECKAECLKICSCTAYAKSNISESGTGCLVWYGDLIDIRRLTRASDQSLYIRVSAEDLARHSNKKKMVMPVVIPLSVALGVVLLVLACCIIRRKRSQRGVAGTKQKLESRRMEDLELPTFELLTIAKATNHFSDSNKIGEGGFGTVYKGQIATGQEIAVKRLSVDSNQGLNELKTELVFISKLQHRNLVRLLGCCIQGEERMLIYEYMPNKSLNNYIYDSTRKNILPWIRRFDIILGIARGLLYLHRDSRLRIIHRDLKASNVLLDNEMNPKISDFGIARAFGGEQILAKTTRVIGTYGYMAPEYVIDGLYSMKSDVFSFGVLILEILSSKRNRDFHHPDHNLNLLGHAWKLWTEGKAFQLIDEQMEEPFPLSEVERCIQIGLLCVQQQPQDRPTMSTVLLMLDSQSTILPPPKHPGFYTERNACDSKDQSEERCTITNDETITLITGR